MTNEQKEFLKNTISVLNSDGVQAGTKNVASYFWGLIENSGKKVSDADSPNTTPKNKTSCTPQISSSMEHSDEESNLRQPYFK